MQPGSNDKTAAKVTKTAAKATLSDLSDALNEVHRIATILRFNGTTSDAFHAGSIIRDIETMQRDIATAIALQD